jgi:hypothetical protein
MLLLFRKLCELLQSEGLPVLVILSFKRLTYCTYRGILPNVVIIPKVCTYAQTIYMRSIEHDFDRPNSAFLNPK